MFNGAIDMLSHNYYIYAYHCQFCTPGDTKLYRNNENQCTFTVRPLIDQQKANR